MEESGLDAVNDRKKPAVEDANLFGVKPGLFDQAELQPPEEITREVEIAHVRYRKPGIEEFGAQAGFVVPPEVAEALVYWRVELLAGGYEGAKVATTLGQQIPILSEFLEIFFYVLENIDGVDCIDGIALGIVGNSTTMDICAFSKRAKVLGKFCVWFDQGEFTDAGKSENFAGYLANPGPYLQDMALQKWREFAGYRSAVILRRFQGFKFKLNCIGHYLPI